MSNYRDQNRESITKHIVDLEGRFFPDDVTAIDNTLNKGHGFSVLRTGVGAYTITLDKVYLSLISFKVNLQLDTAKDLKAELGDVDLANKTIKVRIVKKSTGAADEGGVYDANQSLSFRFALKQTSAI